MPFKTVHFCTLCDEEVTPNNMLQHEQVDCPQLPQNVAQKEAENEAWEQRWNGIRESWDAWQEKREKARRPIIHAYPSIDHKPRERAVEGRCVLISLQDEFFGGDESKPYVSRVLTNPTWGTVLVEFDKSIFVTGDSHHSFLEGLRRLPRKQLPKGVKIPSGITVLEFSTGS